MLVTFNLNSGFVLQMMRCAQTVFCVFTGIPTDEEQATGLEKVIMKAMKEGKVLTLVCHQKLLQLVWFLCMIDQSLIGSGFCSNVWRIAVRP